MRVPPAFLLASLLTLSACGSAGDAPPGGSEGDRGGGTLPTLSGTLTVFAAASLTDVFTDLGEQLEAQHPDLEVQFNFAGSSALAGQLTQGAPADVFAAADEAQMARVAEAGLAGDAELFASNRLMLAFPADNPAGLRKPPSGIPSLGELLPEDLTLAVCAPEVPCGAAAQEVLEQVGRTDAPDTYEEDVRGVLTKVQLGEVDAGLVYRTDVMSGEIPAFAFAESEAAQNRYPVAVLDDAPNAAAARAFTDLLLSEEGRRALTDAGFFEP
ncbi:molybdate ABC transporter substrate-binding protein [Blastococcus sp. TF02A-35]|uniref:molybdate ABC transporter substrate-binding protein n=1 Tax=Blastococcus sp. TF02A-35 TaxID=2559612 RepID=UPI001074775A|nr:molybdate ABC transporter substrate-binding protein [Blastococcus sp. TF02A_35]TFV46266.1 molybdate ABC transporter substrate-binding protein [Blastococcus sp. TF02A_35]